uniref:Receptor ligand binding region domain-containing protein n=1 Tax=Strigamia maritima TaxID=126957 RepID=T1J917_STRMM
MTEADELGSRETTGNFLSQFLPSGNLATSMRLLKYVVLLVVLVTEKMRLANGGGTSQNPSKDVAKETVNVGVSAPYSAYKSRIRNYNKNWTQAMNDLEKRHNLRHIFDNFNVPLPPITLRSQMPNPGDTLETLCDDFLQRNVCIIVFLSNSEMYGHRETAATLYFLQLSAYIGMPVISFIADNSAMEQKHPSSLLLQLSPSVRHQCEAMFSILNRYNWKQFSILVSEIPGRKQFILAVNEMLIKDDTFELLKIIDINSTNLDDLNEKLSSELLNSESRVQLLYANKFEAKNIFKVANTLGLTSKDYMWIVSQSVIMDFRIGGKATPEFPIGLMVYKNALN